jgi:chemotaxis protein MotB
MTIQSPEFRSSALALRSPDRAGAPAASRWLPAAGPAGPAGAPAPDLADPVPVQGSDDEVWMLSYMDIMTLLVTLFVLLFVYTRAVAPESAAVAGAVGSGQPAEARVAAAPARFLLEADTRVDLPPHWLASLVEPPIPELVVRLGDAPEVAGVTNPAVDAGEVVVADATAEVTGETMAVDAPTGNGVIVAEVPAPFESVPVFEADRTAPANPQDLSAAAAHPAAAVLAEQPVFGTRDPSPSRPAVDEPPVGPTAPPEGVEQSLLAAVKASELGGRVEVTQRQDAVNLEISDEILFDRGSAEVRPGGEALLAELARLLAHQGLTISVEGHTDNVPIRNARFASNWELSAARATAVTRQLVAHAVDPARVRAVGHADTKPRAGNATAEGRARNRRVSLVLHVLSGATAEPMAATTP